ncbi:Uncharacterised protein [Orientia tsutsugamushi]|uniref:Uncharacterized protein n=1 Tax=Orientia tsutsugamushi TaxID=784 RepID=A0A2U3RMW4_ORITS|nr:hypothetical protein OTSKARP_0737 [Orientia tsutsugamushi str. Karp]SPR14591.1 Uncharacterised protein [Orientia tsutsugamushi]
MNIIKKFMHECASSIFSFKLKVSSDKNKTQVSIVPLIGLKGILS